LPQIGIDDLNVFRVPAEFQGPEPQGILQAQAFLIGEHLLERRLANVDQGFAGQMGRGDEF
jgi:hypothetical protein